MRSIARGAVAGEGMDYLLLAAVVALVLIGLQMVYSASFALSLSGFGDPNYLITRQLAWAVVGGIALLVLSRIDYRLWKRWSLWLMLLSLATLMAVLVPGLGVTHNEARRWLALGPFFEVQPSEFAKLALVIYISAWLAGRGEKLRGFATGFVPFILVVGLVSGLVLRQPDFGTMVVIVLVSSTLFFVAGADLRQFAALTATGGVALVTLILTEGYRSARLAAFFNPWATPRGSGYHIIQTLIALGSGGLTGLGLGASRQKFFYVPGAHTDAIFAIIGEEIGFLGATVVLALFGILAYRGFRLAFKAPDTFGSLLALGISCWFLYQAMINIGGVTKSIPFTGITLPFISYGGSSLTATMAAAGVLLSISRYCAAPERRYRRKTSEPLVLPCREGP